MELRYYSQWVFYLFVLWCIGYVLKISWITRYLHPYYMTLFASIGFTGLLVYWTNVKDQSFEPTFLLFLMLIHYAPLYISYKYSSKTYALHCLILTLLLYFLYVTYNHIHPFKTYLTDQQPESWKDLEVACQTTQLSPLCTLYLRMR